MTRIQQKFAKMQLQAAIKSGKVGGIVIIELKIAQLILELCEMVPEIEEKK